MRSWREPSALARFAGSPQRLNNCYGRSSATVGSTGSSSVVSGRLGPYVADFVCLEGKLIVEVDGEPHELTIAHDTVRDSKLSAMGYRVLRFRNDEVRGNLEGVCQDIRNALGAAVPPSP